MIENIQQLKDERPDLVADFEKMTKEELLKQCYLECIDAINMEERVALFMSECTNNMSKTNYTLGSLKSLINENKEREIDGKFDTVGAGRHHLLWLEEQLTISGVVKSLPVNREFALKVREELIEKHYKDDPNKNTFGLAFITCYDWLAKLCTK